MAYLPVFFLFFNNIVSLQEVLLLESVYYISVVFIEVPSGYFSDKIGRKKTLIISSILFILSYLVFGLSYSFMTLASGQVLLAAAISFRSGTDTSFFLRIYSRCRQRRRVWSERSKRPKLDPNCKCYCSFNWWISRIHQFIFTILFICGHCLSSTNCLFLFYRTWLETKGIRTIF